MANTDVTHKLVAEFVGTFMLVFTVGCNVLSGNAVWGGVSIACVLMVAIYALGGISGANFNPAVSFSLGLSKEMGGPGMDWKDVVTYVVVQILGGLSAAFLYLFLFKDSFNLSPAAGFKWQHAGACELIYTFMLCFVVLNVAVARKNDPERGGEANQYYGLAIGFVIVAGAYGAGAVSGGCFNPAVAIAIDVSSAYYGIGWCIAYTVFELIGAAIAVALFKVVRPTDFQGRGGDVSLLAPSRAQTSSTSIAPKLTSEFIGTYMLVLTVGLNVLGKSPAGAYSIAAALMCMIYALGDVSGAHFNPAVTLAVSLSGLDEDLSHERAAKYVVMQLAGGVSAAVTYSLIYSGQAFGLGPKGDVKWSQVGMAEVMFTMLLCYVVLCVACGINETKQKDFFGLCIGSCVTVGGFAIGGISGGSLNPAVSVGIEASNFFFGGGGLMKCVIYSVYECLGACIAAGMLGVTHDIPKQ